MFGDKASGKIWLLVGLVALSATVAAPRTATAKPAQADESEAEASFVAKQAIDYYKNGDPLMAADLYRRAYRIDPSKPEYLFGAARAEQKAGKAQEALVAYQMVMALLPSTDPLAKKSKTAIAEIQAAAAAKPATPAAPTTPTQTVEPVRTPEPPAPAQPAPGTETAPSSPDPDPAPPGALRPIPVAPQAARVADVTRPAPEAAWKQPVGWTLVATGGAAVLTGAVLAVIAASGKSSLEANKLPDGTHYDPTKITADEIRSQQTAINGQVTGAVICGAVGVVAAGVGTWALLTAPSAKVVWTPGPTPLGTGLAVRF